VKAEEVFGEDDAVQPVCKGSIDVELNSLAVHARLLAVRLQMDVCVDEH
jgi:hypothetical protein